MLLCNKYHSSYTYSPSWGCRHIQLAEAGPGSAVPAENLAGGCCGRKECESVSTGSVGGPHSRTSGFVCFILTQFLANPNSPRAHSRGYINNGCFVDSLHHLCCPITISVQHLSAASPGLWKQSTLARLYFVSGQAHIYPCPASFPPAVPSIQMNGVSLAYRH